ncbi:MAG: Peptidoglycan-N-acetylmuramic acid deacetylase PdaC [Candidatus Parcubacteria bacterium]|jgi:hypothetical protein
MKKNLGLIVILIIVFSGASFLYLKAFKKGEEAHQFSHASSTEPVIVQYIELIPRSFNESSKTSGYEVKATYPEVAGLRNTYAQKTINEIIVKKVQSVISDFKKSLSQAEHEKDEISTLDINFTQERITAIANIVSFRLTEAYYAAGAAHPVQTTETYSFDTRTGRVISLSLLFIPGSDYLQRISTYSISELKKKLGTAADEDQITRGAGPDAENFPAFVLGDTGIKIIFSQYQVAAYAAGEQEIVVPYGELKEFISKDGPIGTIIQQ